MKSGNVTFFETPALLRRWFQKNHSREKVLWIGFRKKASGLPTITYREALDLALCFGWIDGIKKSVDVVSYTYRFTPRRPGSVWSPVNIKRYRELLKLGRVQPTGVRAFGAPRKTRTPDHRLRSFTAAMVKTFRSNKKAWNFFQLQPPGYRKLCTFWVMEAKLDATRERRLATLIADSAAGRRIGLLARPARK
jgi:uncharacterized protein YdeI (YjbR/CyaY-like superfamily)